MLSIREKVFETNSSSVHSLTLVSKEQYDEWQEGKVYFINGYDRFIKPEELYDFVKNEITTKYLEEYEKKAELRSYEAERKKAIEYCFANMSKEEFDSIFVELMDEANGYMGYDLFDEYYEERPSCKKEDMSKASKKGIVVEMVETALDEGIATFDGWWEDVSNHYETYEQSQTFGDNTVVAFGYYGHD